MSQIIAALALVAVFAALQALPLWAGLAGAFLTVAAIVKFCA